MSFRPVELFVICDTYEQCIEQYEKALNTLYDLGKNGIRRSEIGKLDRREDQEFFMTRFGFKVFRVVYGTQYERDEMKFFYTILKTVKAEDINIQEFITNYINQENEPVDISDESYKINISVPITDNCRMVNGDHPSKIAEIFCDELDSRKIYYVRNRDISYFADVEVDNIARIRFYFGNDSCSNLLTSAYTGDIWTYARFAKNYKKLITRILRYRNKNTRAN